MIDAHLDVEFHTLRALEGEPCPVLSHAFAADGADWVRDSASLIVYCLHSIGSIGVMKWVRARAVI